METLTVSETRKDFTRLPAHLARKKSDKVLQVTSNGKPVLAMLPWKTYERMASSLAMLNNPEVMADIREFEKLERTDALKEVQWADLKAELGL